ncbi:Eukaryotic translation initiation factor 4 gamma protein [Rutstroemia sp. NJR-2017a WRK4]|nr:Eukaryotic translation initiation factor 4 gamma protein [Rutstroemia sp. NJR-2017a WRK4]
MTSVSQQSQIPSQASNSTSASQSTPSYASTAKKAVSSPPIATSSSTPSPAVAVGGSAPVQQHGKSSSISPVNGRASIPPAVPAVSAPAIAHSSSALNGGSTDHSRKSSVTISANGPPAGYIPNGGPVGGSKGGIQFGSITDSPAASHSTPQISQPASGPIPIPGNPRIISPAHSPSPIPQPAASGGRPPSGIAGQGNGMTFGSLGTDGDRHMRQASSQGPLAPNNQQAGHLRRESSQSTHSDMSNQGPGAGRGGFQQGGRGRGGYNPQYQGHTGFPPSNAPQFRNTPNAGRGGMPPFQTQGRPQYQNSPHQAARSPALANSLPGTPNMNQAMPMQTPQQFNNPYYQQPHMGAPQVVQPPFIHQQSDSLAFQNSRGKNKKWFDKFQGQQRHRKPSTELFGHNYTFNEQSSFEHGGPSQDIARNRISSMQSEHPEVRRAVSNQQTKWQLHPDLEPNLTTTSDQSVQDQSLPPLPSATPHFSIPPPDLSKIDFSPEHGNFEQFLTSKQNYGGYPPAFDNRLGMPMGGQPPYVYPQMTYMHPMPPSPQPGYQQPAYMPGQYAPQAQPMSRNSSQLSEHRPASSMGQAQTPSITPVSHGHTPQPKPVPQASSQFSRPSRKSAAILIKRPDGEVLDVDAVKAPASPAPSARTRTPPVVASTPTPPPKSATPQHTRTDSAVTKSKEEIRAEVMEKVKKAAEADKAAADQAKNEEAAKAAKEAEAAEAAAAEAKLKEEEKAKQEEKAAAEAKEKAEAEAKAAAEKAKQDEEDELERQIREMEEAEAERERKEAELLAKRAEEKAKAAKEKEEAEKANAAENDRKLKEAEREMERLEDEREKKRAEAEAKAKGGDAKKDAPEDKDGPSTLASRLSNLNVGNDSGASTPASDDSMGPPPKTLAAEKRGKPAALNLTPLNTKPVEPPQPSAALQSLKSSRFLTVLDSSIYPPNISSPNPALNNAVKAKGKSFKYDKEFLLQFQKVFTEKPSMEFESQIKALIGDGDGGSARPGGSQRTPAGMGPRGSNRGSGPGAFAMGQFGAVGGKTLPPGTTSAERFAMSSGNMQRPGLNTINPMASFTRPGGAFPAGAGMQRTNSSNSSMGGMPHSPRQPSRSQRGGSKREGYQGSNVKQEAQNAKNMPLTAGMDVKPIQVSATGWKPRSIGQTQSATGAAGPTPGAVPGAGHMDPDMVQRKVKAALNKMTPEKFDKIADQILAIAAQSKDEADGRTLRQVIQLTFEKATDEAHWASMYAKFCKRMLETMSPDIKDESILDKNGNVVSGGNLFRKYLLNRCQEEFERGWKIDLPEKPEGEREDAKTEEAAMLSDEYYIAAAAKRRGLGLVQFIGELYKLSMLTERIMHECVKKLVDYNGIPDEAEIESLTKLLKTIGGNLDSTEKGRPLMDVYFTRIQSMIDAPELPSRLRFMLMDIVDLRKKRWASKEDNKGPKTLEEVRAEAEAAAAHKAAESSRTRGGGGGGGRMQMGRGDSRNFSGGYGNQPPPDYQKNTVGMDDLRRLTNKGGVNRQSSQQMSFGPTSMFSSRSNSGRKLGPGGSLGRTGEDSGASSRTGTPPQDKEKKSATSANAFSLLAGLSSGEPENPASPPSTHTSPVLSKATAASDKKESDS